MGWFRPIVFTISLVAVLILKSVDGQDSFLFGFSLPSHGALFATQHSLNLGVILKQLMPPAEVRKVLKVACRSMGFRGTPTLMSKGSYTHETSNFGLFLRIDGCQGNEVSLSKCSNAIQFHGSTIKIGCGYPSVLVTFSNTTNQSSVAAGSSPMFALSEGLKSCFISKMEKDPWIKVYVTKSLFIHTLTIVLGNASQTPVVATYRKSRVNKCNVTMVTGSEHTVKCQTDFKANAIKITLEGENLNLALCRIDVFGIESKEQTRGVYFDAWKDKPSTGDGLILKSDRLFYNVTPDEIHYIPTFDVKNRPLTPTTFTLRQFAYLMVKESGTYSIGVACKHLCEVWLKRAKEEGLGAQGTSYELLVKFEMIETSSSSEKKYEMSSQQNKKIQLSTCHLYNIVVYSWLGYHLDEGYTNMAVKLPGASSWSAPFPRELLYWTKPGSRNLYFTIINEVSNKVDLGSHLVINATYKLCCDGMVCPTCPMKLYLHAFDETIVVNNSLHLNCQQHNLTYETDLVVQPKNYTIQISYSFVEDVALWEETRTVINNVQVTVSIIYSCDFTNQRCDGWKVSENKSSAKQGISRRENPQGDSFLFPAPGSATLESPVLPWTEAYKRIRLCMQFSYLLQSTTASPRLDVYSVTHAGETLIWSVEGHQGTTWERARISLQIYQAFRIHFKSNAQSNATVIAIKMFEVSTDECTRYPVHATPGFSCPATKYQCANKRCVEKMYHCNGLKDGCIDGSDEDGCKCSTGYFTCSDGNCIDYSKLCDNIKDCKDGEDEYNCDVTCKGNLCFDGTCVTGPCNARICEDKTHVFFKCGYCSFHQIKNCEEQLVLNDTECLRQQGTCGFENGPCGLQSDQNSTFRWDFYSPTSKSNKFPNFDHSMSSEGSYFMLRPSMNQSGTSELKMKWSQPRPYCMQFWFVIPTGSRSSIEVFLKTQKAKLLLWKSRQTTTTDWSFGQLQVPNNSVGELIIVGHVTEDFVALDDLSFIEGHCVKVTSQENPSCYFDDGKVCNMHVDSAWLPTTRPLPNMQKQYSHQASKDAYLTLSRALSFPAKIKSPLLYPKADGWRCLRFWLYSGKDYFSRKLDVVYVTGKGARIVWSYTRANNKWMFVQLNIPEEEETLQAIIQGRRNNDAVIEVDDITFSKYHCQNIPENKLGQECYNYKVLYSPERRTDKTPQTMGVYSSDDILGTKTWYRISRSAGNQVAEYCVSYPHYACSTLYKGWIKGGMPSVDQGQVQREMCFSSQGRGCCKPSKNVTVRNCGEYFVYKFPKPPNIESKFCSVYSHKYLKLSVEREWESWTNISVSSQMEWKILSYDEFNQISKSVQDSSYHLQEKERNASQDVWFALNGSAMSFDVKLTGYLKSFTMCLWLSVDNTSPLAMTLILRDSPFGMPRQKTFMMTRTNASNSWKHFCFTWKSDFGVWQSFIDGVFTDYSIYFFDLKELQNGILGLAFSSKESTLLKINGLNVWDAVLAENEILFMSYACQRQKGNLVDWEHFHQTISMVTNPKSSIIGYKPSACNGRLGNTMSLLTKTKTDSASIVSPRYERSEAPGRCLKFRYRLWGPGARALKLYQIMDDSPFPRRPIWMDNVRNSSAWREGHVTLSTIMAYRIAIEGESTDGPGLVSIGALKTTEGYCPPLPTTAGQACHEILTNNTGYVISPYYPGYHSNNLDCTWTIKAKKDHVIRLEIKEFELEMSPQCENDFVEVFDGDSAAAALRISRFCGIRYPPIIQSTSNSLFIVFQANAAVVRTGFMAYYQLIQDKQKNSDCVQDCPADCICERLPGHDHRIVITSTNLRSVPDRLPKESSTILFPGNQIFQLESESFYNLPRLIFIDLSLNKILQMETKTFMELPLLKALRLNRNFIKTLQDGTWISLPALENLDIGENLITSVSGKTFSELNSLKVLSLRRNKIQELHADSFQNNSNLTYLYLDENSIQTIPPGIFRHQRKLKVLKLHANKLKTFDKSTFKGLEALEKLTLDNNTIKESTIPQDVFEDLTNLKHLKLDSFILCCYAKESIPGLTCDSPGNSFSSCEDMLKNIVIRLGIWVQAIFASVGNLSVIIWWRILSKRAGSRSGKANVQSFLLTNLALADFLMGLYLLIIAIQDAIWKDIYFKHDVDWRSGITCQIAGGLSTLSSEVSVMILVAMTTDRLNTIVFDFRAKRLNLKAVRILCFFVWVIGALISFMPLILPNYFNDTISGFSFYGRSTVCLPLQLSSDQPPGWEYSVAVFIVFNGAAIFFIFVAYLTIFIKVQRSAKQVRSTRGSSSALGKRVVFVVLTDFCCWMPVIVLGVLSLAGIFKDPSGQVYAWIAVFVLPVNSSINPILYTFSTPQVKKKLRSIRTKRCPAIVSQTLRTQASCVRERSLTSRFSPTSSGTIMKANHTQNGMQNGGHEESSGDTSLDTKL